MKKTISKIIELIIQAQELATSIGISSLLQPGLVKEIIISQTLNHQIITSKRDADACDKKGHSIKYEYLSCYEGGAGQLDRMFKYPEKQRNESLTRITRNKKIYLAIFYKKKSAKNKNYL